MTNENVVTEMAKYFDMNEGRLGKVDEIQQYLTSAIPNSIFAQNATTVRKLLHDEFKMKYTKPIKQNIRYYDLAFNEKRLWVSRLLA